MGSFFTFMLAFCHFALVRRVVGRAAENLPAPKRGLAPAAGDNAETGLRFRRVSERRRRSRR
jgi:hypothetical protein